MSCPLQSMATTSRGVRRRMAAALRRTAGAALRIPGVRRAVLAAAGFPFDPFGSAFRKDPYRFYHGLRRRDPVYFARIGCWLISGYAEAAATLRAPQCGHPDHRTALLENPQPTALDRQQCHMLLSNNPPDHTRMRRVVNSILTPAVVEGVRPKVQELADRLLDRVAAARRMDVIGDFAYPLAVGTIANLLGVPEGHVDRLADYGRRSSATAIALVPSRSQLDQGNAAVEWLGEYFHARLDERRRAPRADLLSGLVEAHETGHLDVDEATATGILLFTAGYETTIGLIGNGMLALLRDADALAQLREDTSLTQSAVEEFLRYDSPIPYVGRLAREDVRIGDKLIRRGQQIYVVIAAANRDPARFPEPDRLDIARPDNRHLSFSGGIHACPGPQLSRMEAQIAIATLVRRFPGMALRAEGPIWADSQLHSLTSLPISF
ncbi:MAG TPA: cytochrome P450 [Candidatus Methylomirabilis sp.]|nr:cytochrome P450 [Candidatus Methylomirabilis sp.]